MGVSDRMLSICCYGSFILQYQRRVPVVVQLHQLYFGSSGFKRSLPTVCALGQTNHSEGLHFPRSPSVSVCL